MFLNTEKIEKNSNEFPSLLKEISSVPNSIYYQGNLPNDNELCIAIVGTRKASEYGQKTAESIAYNLAKEGVTIVSGLALGIDTSAHKGALLAGGKTVAVLGHGLDRIYPTRNKELAKEIIDNQGCLISEYKEGASITPKNFLARNRIVSGLSKAIIVIEAPYRSGSISTAGHAGDQGRDVCVVPGPVNSPTFKGSHKLIRDGARLATSAKEILEDLGFNVKNNLI
ncbi:MAG: DNA-processing protein DprA [Candidatus Paceibacterota bacterium]